jgi:hypothetical protein
VGTAPPILQIYLQDEKEPVLKSRTRYIFDFGLSSLGIEPRLET